MMVISGHQERLMEAWQRTRFETYITACTSTAAENRPTIFEFLPLPGDPTKEELEAMKAAAKDAEYKEAKKLVDEGAEFVKMLQQAALNNKK